jgi:exopolysaccharide biosynthesis polyprenyl glycosylphosphotransferase
VALSCAFKPLFTGWKGFPLKRGQTVPLADDSLVDLRDDVVTLSHAGERSDRSFDPLRTYRRVAVWMALCDGVVILAAFFVARWLNPTGPTRTLDTSLTLWIAPPLFVAVFAYSRLYSIQRYDVTEEFKRLISAVTVSVAAVMLVSFWSGSFSRDWIVSVWLLSMLFILVERWIWHGWLVRHRRTGRLVLRTLVVGEQADAEQLAGSLRAGETGFDPIGLITSGAPSPLPGDTPVLGDIAGISRSIDHSSADCVVMALGGLSIDQITTVAKAARRAGVETRMSIDIPQVLPGRVTVQSVAGLMTLALHPVKLTGFQSRVKRASDIVGASFGLLIAAPVMLVVAISIRTTSKGPILFRQRRVTKGGRVFTVYKFRTMYVDADARIRERSLDTQVPFFKTSSEDLVTPIGRYLRRLSLDELPQLWNVLKGDMSLVGPRPLPEEQVVANLELLGPRHELRTGLTGWWQVNGRSDVSPEEAVQQDLFFIENWSLALDISIMFKTLGVLVHTRGAY